ncbi:MAG: hypothetical protein ACLPX8_09535 [Bryobacteraceae bacterium]|jgi:hypothetical protein
MGAPAMKADSDEGVHWTRATAIGLARATCVHCRGAGTRLIRETREVPCACVFRGIFRACYNRFRECVELGAHTGTVSWDRLGGKTGRRYYSRKKEEYAADFCLVSRRALTEAEYALFRYHFLLGADWRLCCRQLKIDRGTFFHEVYRIEQLLGRTFAELQPYALYPVSEYFAGVMENVAEAPPGGTGLLGRRETDFFPGWGAAGLR